MLYWEEFCLLVTEGIVGPGPGSSELGWQACGDTGDPLSSGCCGHGWGKLPKHQLCPRGKPSTASHPYQHVNGVIGEEG